MIVLVEEGLETPPSVGLGAKEEVLPVARESIEDKERTERTPQERGGPGQGRQRLQRAEV